MRRAAPSAALAFLLCSAAASAADDRKPAENGGEGRRSVALTINPLPLVAGRYGANLDVLPVAHHAITTTVFLQTFPMGLVRQFVPNGIVLTDPPSRVGGELGYRLYTSGRSASGFFMGPSLLLMPIAYPRATDAGLEVTSFHAFGAALDVGVQAVTSGGFTIGGGVGVMGLAYSLPRSNVGGVEIPTVPTPHVLPRLLLATGWSF